jgi:dTDP-4-amino-4,6-dideoxygalactose transaminase
MLTTRDPELDRRFRRERQHGMDIPDIARHSTPQVVNERHDTIGFNYRMTDVQAAIGRVQLTRLPEILERRRTLADRYLLLLKDLPISLPEVPAEARTNWQSFMIELPESCDRRSLMQAMLDAGIATRRGIHCAHREPAYAKEPWRMGAGGLARSERAQDLSLVLPLFHEMTETEQDDVVSALRVALDTERRPSPV